MKYSAMSCAVPRSPIRDMMARAAALEDSISFAVGQPDFPPEQAVLDAARQAVERRETKYAPGAGYTPLREAYASYLSGITGQPYAVENVVVTAGGMAALFLSLQCLLDPGDEVLIGAPYFSNYAQQVMMCGGRVVPVKTWEADGFQLLPEAVEQAVTPRSKVLLLNSPCNPTGSVLSRETLEELAEIALRHDLFVISDEVYRHILYDGQTYTSIASLPGMKERTLVVDSCSKAFAMPGMRVGFGAGPAELIALMIKLTEGVYSCGVSISEYTAMEALRKGAAYRDAMAREYERRRDYLVPRINAISGLSCVRPKGAFYLFVNVRDTGLSGKAYSERLLEAEHVSVVPGDNFGGDAADYVRLSYAVSAEDIARGCERMEHFSRSLRL